jgi:hypothetical protein
MSSSSGYRNELSADIPADLPLTRGWLDWVMQKLKFGVQMLCMNITSTTTAAAAENNLMTFLLRANTLARAGQAVRIKVWGLTAANANAKTLKFYIGATQLVTTGALAANDKDWYLEILIIRGSSGSAQVVFVNGTFNNALVLAVATTAAEDLTTGLTLKCTATSDTAAADIIQKGMIVELLN